MGRLKIGGRLNVVSLVALAGLALVLVLSLVRIDSVMRSDIADRTQKVVEIAHSTAAHYHELERSGQMTRKEAQAAALNAIRSMRYGETEYFWVNDMAPNMVMHPIKPELDGTDVSGNADADGKYIFREMVSVVKENGSGFVDYKWPKPGFEEAQPKISFVQGFAPWGWVIGSGVYVDDIQAAVTKVAVEIGTLALVIALLVGGFNLFLSRSITRPISAVTTRMRGLAEGDTNTSIPGIDRADEVGEMARGLRVFRDAAVAKNEAEAAKAEADAQQKFVVEELSQRLSKVADGDLTTQIDVEFPSAYATLKNNFNRAIGELRELIGSFSAATLAIRTGSNEIAQASEDLAQRTESNAASLEETSAAIAQMETRLRTTAEAASRTAEQTVEATQLVNVGRATAEKAVGAMNRVSGGAEGIDSVIEGLDKIAFQTRVLAMNAAVEAGRAGEAGRGFAVVADLVSALAMRSEEEAKRAREQLTTTQADISTAVETVRGVDEALENIIGSVQQVNELVGTVVEDNRAQSLTIGEITTAMGSMDQSTQQNAAMVEETSAAARNLALEVVHLSEGAAQFKTDHGSASAPVSRSGSRGAATSQPPSIAA
ncbi:methyl-accepting chemotaxis protein [Alteriqipengyuania sp. 357]